MVKNVVFQGGSSKKYFVYFKSDNDEKVHFYHLKACSATPLSDPVSSQASGVTDSHGVTGGVYKARERIHRSILICDY